MTPEQAAAIVAAKRRGRQPTSFDKRMGLIEPSRRPVPPRHDRAAPVYDPCGNAKANGSNRSYSYMTNGETWALMKKGQL